MEYLIMAPPISTNLALGQPGILTLNLDNRRDELVDKIIALANKVGIADPESLKIHYKNSISGSVIDK